MPRGKAAVPSEKPEKPVVPGEIIKECSKKRQLQGSLERANAMADAAGGFFNFCATCHVDDDMRFGVDAIQLWLEWKPLVRKTKNFLNNFNDVFSKNHKLEDDAYDDHQRAVLAVMKKAYDWFECVLDKAVTSDSNQCPTILRPETLFELVKITTDYAYYIAKNADAMIRWRYNRVKWMTYTAVANAKTTGIDNDQKARAAAFDGVRDDFTNLDLAVKNQALIRECCKYLARADHQRFLQRSQELRDYDPSEDPTKKIKPDPEAGQERAQEQQTQDGRAQSEHGQDDPAEIRRKLTVQKVEQDMRFSYSEAWRLFHERGGRGLVTDDLKVTYEAKRMGAVARADTPATGAVSDEPITLD